MRIALGILTIVAAAATAPLQAQDRFPRLSAELAVGLGQIEHTTDGSGLDGDTGAGAFRLDFEGIARGGMGGGLRLDMFSSDDDLFVDNGFNASTAHTNSLYAHFTYRLEQDVFAMPMRIGLMVQTHNLEETVSGDEVTFVSAGPMFELAPEVFLLRDDDIGLSLRATLALGVGGTWIDVDNDPEDYTSTTLFYGFEFGPRIYFGNFDCAFTAVVRGHTMDDSDVSGGTYVLGYDSTFAGVLFSFGYSH